MRYDHRNNRIEISSCELCACSASSHIDDSFDDIAESITSGPPCDVFLLENFDGIDFYIEGHISSVYGSHDLPTVAEIILSSDVNNIMEHNPSSHICCLAYILCKTSGIDRVNIETILYDTISDNNVREITVRTIDQLEKQFKKRIYRLLPKARIMIERSNSVLQNAASVKFPFSMLRDGQEDLMRICYESLCNKERLFVQAPTGIGKTISALYPAVKFLGNGHCDKVFYLTAKNSTQKEAYRAAGKLFECGARLRTIILSSREACCINPSKTEENFQCSAMNCKYARRNAKEYEVAINDLLKRQNGYDREIIIKISRKFGLCPYELSLALSEYCEIIISDYNYIFDPIIRLDRYFGKKRGINKYLLLVDEAHNLADRTREMYSSEISLLYIKKIYCQIQNEIPILSDSLENIIRFFEKDIKRLCSEDIQKDDDDIIHGFYTNRKLPNNLMDNIKKLYDIVNKTIKNNENIDYINLLQNLKKKLFRLIITCEYFDERFLFYCELNGEDVILKIFCLDPSQILDDIHSTFEASVMFSATLTPLEYFSDILGGGKKSRILSLASPFDIDNLFLAACGGVSTRYEDREKTLSKVVSYISAAVACKKGNYIVYFPSYSYMNKAAELFMKKFPKVRTIVQKPRMNRTDVTNFISEFVNVDDKMRVGFCVLGGTFSEGIDLPGKSLIGVVIVGTGIPGISSERNIIREYYELSRGCGYDYAYTYPGMNNVLQAAGRVIRSDTDKGIVTLIDDRYITPKYQEMYPDHWGKMQYFESAASLNFAITEFWK